MVVIRETMQITLFEKLDMRMFLSGSYSVVPSLKATHTIKRICHAFMHLHEGLPP